MASQSRSATFASDRSPPRPPRGRRPPACRARRARRRSRSPSATSRATSSGTSSRRASGNTARAAVEVDLHAARARERVRRALADRAAAGDDHDPVADELDLAEQMGVQQHGDPPLAQALEDAADEPAPGGIQRAGGLVEQHEPRRADERLRDARGAAACPSTSSRRAARVASARPTSSSSSRALGGARLRSGRGAGAARAARPPSPNRGSGTARPGSPWRRARATLPARCPQASAVPLGRAHEPAGDLRQRRLARAVGPEQADELALGHLQVDAGQRFGAAVALADGAEGESRGGHGPGRYPSADARPPGGGGRAARAAHPPSTPSTRRAPSVPRRSSWPVCCSGAGFEVDAGRHDRGAAEPRRPAARAQRGPGALPALARRHGLRDRRGLAAGSVVGRGDRRRGLGPRRDRHEVPDGGGGRRGDLAGARAAGARARRPAWSSSSSTRSAAGGEGAIWLTENAPRPRPLRLPAQRGRRLGHALRRRAPLRRLRRREGRLPLQAHDRRRRRPRLESRQRRQRAAEARTAAAGDARPPAGLRRHRRSRRAARRPRRAAGRRSGGGARAGPHPDPWLASFVEPMLGRDARADPRDREREDQRHPRARAVLRGRLPHPARHASATRCARASRRCSATRATASSSSRRSSATRRRSTRRCSRRSSGGSERNDPGARVVPTMLPAFTDSRTFRAAFPDCVAYGFFPHRHMTLQETWPMLHAADERIDARDVGFATACYRDVTEELLGGGRQASPRRHGPAQRPARARPDALGGGRPAQRRDHRGRLGAQAAPARGRRRRRACADCCAWREAVAVIPLVKRGAARGAAARGRTRRCSPPSPRPARAASSSAAAGGGRAGGEAMMAALSVLPSVVALRGGEVAEWHGVEHKAIAAYETDGDAAEAAKEHDRCGSHLMAPMLAANLAGTALLHRVTPRAEPGRRRARWRSPRWAIAVEVFVWAERHGSTTRRARAAPARPRAAAAAGHARADRGPARGRSRRAGRDPARGRENVP